MKDESGKIVDLAAVRKAHKKAEKVEEKSDGKVDKVKSLIFFSILAGLFIAYTYNYEPKTPELPESTQEQSVEGSPGL